MNNLDWGFLQPWIEDESVTDINCNGQSMWIDHLKKGRFEVEGLQREALVTLSYRIANFVNESFNQVHPLIEAETSDLRISLIHESLSKSGHALSIRKTPRLQRLNRKQMLLDEYMPKCALDFLEQAIQEKRNVMVCGLPGAGKT
ncbi:MAG: ATPase, T2SS/T4P/T4SS family, partial [Erysipelotrichaceae bacterium]